MEKNYGVGVGNRFELFYVDEEAGNSTNKISKKAKTQKKTAAAPTSTNVAANGGTINYLYLSHILHLLSHTELNRPCNISLHTFDQMLVHRSMHFMQKKEDKKKIETE